MSISLFATEFVAQKSGETVTIDGLANESCWEKATWYPMDQVWIPYGVDVLTSDFTGRFKLTWNDEKLYILAEITDDSLSDDHPNILDSYWEDDCLEIFIDEDASGGDHTNNFNAFAYHISTLYDAVDLNASGNAEAFTDHIEVIITKSHDSTYIWEVALDVYDDSFTSSGSNTPVSLEHNKTMGFSLAYCDNDETTGRENFFASTEVPEANYNDHWQNASFFGALTLIDSSLINNNPSSVLNRNSSTQQSILYPNPAINGAMVYCNTPYKTIVQIDCYNLSGQKVYSTNTLFINTCNMPKGSYILKIISNNEIFVEQLIVK